MAFTYKQQLSTDGLGKNHLDPALSRNYSIYNQNALTRLIRDGILLLWGRQSWKNIEVKIAVTQKRYLKKK